ncbi:MAG: aminotransferase class I/II-fold pyridoxal phosphate-dependent enzyme, partial [Actinomycetota bacterium]|nr:aminotransferase class I/II-fold pyridoxal phosphate-dependent enzyme [Actinomycetota bacterium]
MVGAVDVEHVGLEGRLAARQGSGTYLLAGGAPRRGDDPLIGALARNQLFAALGEAPAGLLDLATAIPPAASCVAGALPDADDVAALCTETGYLPAGSDQLRVALAEAYSASGLATSAAEILVTTGAQQALSLVASLYLRRGDPVVVDHPTYPGALDVFRAAGAR